MHRRRAGLAGLAAALALVGAGGCAAQESGEERATVAFAQWARAIEKVCAATTGTRSVLGRADPFDPDLTTDQLAQATQTLGVLVERLDAAVVDYQAIDEPDERREEARHFVDASDAAVTELRAAVDAGEDGDVDGFTSAAARGNEQLETARAAATDLGLTACVPDESVTPSTTATATTSPLRVPGV